MFEKQNPSNYRQIFDARGQQYHRAMQDQPLARRAEFENAMQLAAIQSGHVVGDIPAGGGYLRNFLPVDVRLVSVETSPVFLRQNQNGDEDSQILCSSLDAIPLPDNSLDRALSIAGAHHLENQSGFYREVFRLLNPGGVFVLADVKATSPVARFLNEWVNAHNSQGHHGVFLDENVARELRECGFEDTCAQSKKYAWEFKSEKEMIEYCRGLFGLDLAGDAQILAALKTILGVEKIGARLKLRWELLFARAVKPAS